MVELKKIPASHLTTFTVTALLSLIAALLQCPASLENETLARQIEASTGLLLDADSLNAAPATGDPLSPFRLRDAVFLARRAADAPRDLYVARIRTTPADRLVFLEKPVNFTHTEAADEFFLRRHGTFVAVATRTLSRSASVAFFNLAGRKMVDDAEWSPVQRLMAGINDWQRTNRFAGVERRNILFKAPLDHLDFDFLVEADRPGLIVEYNESGERRRVAAVDLNGADTSADNIALSSEVRLPKRPILWLVDSVRAVPWIGPGPIEWAEGRFFAVKDRYRQISYRIVGDRGEGAPAADGAAVEWTPISLPAGVEIGTYDILEWPPAPLPPVAFKNAGPGEGAWSPALPDFVPTLPDAPPSVYRTYLRPDAQRPYVKVMLTAMDTRQLSLHMVGGHEDPRSTTGQVGSGRIPRDPEVLSRVVAAFNGAFKTEHGGYGMMENRTVLLPPLPRAASIATWRDGTMAMGAWGESTDIPAEMVSYRQNMDPLLEDGVVNPRRRYLWGFTLDSDISNMNTIRSGICVRPDGVLIYAWGEDLTAITLGVAMKGAGCNFGMHLDMNPLHTAFIAYGFKEFDIQDKSPQYDAKLLYPGMRYSTSRYINASPKDFFYVTLRRMSPPGPDWSSAELSQPKPAFLPAIHMKRTPSAAAVAINTRFITATADEGASGAETNAGTDREPAELHPLLVAFLPGESEAAGADCTHSFDIDVHGRPSLLAKPAMRAPGRVFSMQEVPPDHAGGVFVVALQDQWLIFAAGAPADVQAILREAGVEEGRAIAMDVTATPPEVLVRTQKGLIDLRGEPVTRRDPRRSAIRFLAAPAPPAAGRLSYPSSN